LTAEQELFARYDREIEVPPFLWTRVAAHTVSKRRAPKRGWFAPSLAATIAGMLLIAVAIGVVYFVVASQSSRADSSNNTVNPPPPQDRF
jgi:hypothetical protein